MFLNLLCQISFTSPRKKGDKERELSSNRTLSPLHHLSLSPLYKERVTTGLSVKSFLLWLSFSLTLSHSSFPLSYSLSRHWFVYSVCCSNVQFNQVMLQFIRSTLGYYSCMRNSRKTTLLIHCTREYFYWLWNRFIFPLIGDKPSFFADNAIISDGWTAYGKV